MHAKFIFFLQNLNKVNFVIHKKTSSGYHINKLNLILPDFN